MEIEATEGLLFVLSRTDVSIWEGLLNEASMIALKQSCRDGVKWSSRRPERPRDLVDVLLDTDMSIWERFFCGDTLRSLAITCRRGSKWSYRRTKIKGALFVRPMMKKLKFLTQLSFSHYGRYGRAEPNLQLYPNLTDLDMAKLDLPPLTGLPLKTLHFDLRERGNSIQYSKDSGVPLFSGLSLDLLEIRNDSKSRAANECISDIMRNSVVSDLRLGFSDGFDLGTTITRLTLYNVGSNFKIGDLPRTLKYLYIDVDPRQSFENPPPYLTELRCCQKYLDVPRLDLSHFKVEKLGLIWDHCGGVSLPDPEFLRFLSWSGAYNARTVKDAATGRYELMCGDSPYWEVSDRFKTRTFSLDKVTLPSSTRGFETFPGTTKCLRMGSVRCYPGIISFPGVETIEIQMGEEDCRTGLFDSRGSLWKEILTATTPPKRLKMDISQWMPDLSNFSKISDLEESDLRLYQNWGMEIFLGETEMIPKGLIERLRSMKKRGHPDEENPENDSKRPTIRY